MHAAFPRKYPSVPAERRDKLPGLPAARASDPGMCRQTKTDYGANENKQ